MKPGFQHRFNNGDIVYWCHSNGWKLSVKYGMVDEQFSDAVVIDFLVPRERRLIDGIPIDQYENPTKYKHLPKGWSYDTRLYEVTYEPMPEEEKNYVFNVKSPVCIKEAYNRGYLVKDSTIFHGKVESEIANGGYRVVKKYPMWEHHIDHVSIRPDKVYDNYMDALYEKQEKEAEFKRQAALTDEEWSIEQIDKTISWWKHSTDSSDEEAQRYHDWFVNMKDVDRIETRYWGGEIQWKYEDKKRWNYIEL